MYQVSDFETSLKTAACEQLRETLTFYFITNASVYFVQAVRLCFKELKAASGDLIYNTIIHQSKILIRVVDINRSFILLAAHIIHLLYQLTTSTNPLSVPGEPSQYSQNRACILCGLNQIIILK